jgi:hypothetical protein
MDAPRPDDDALQQQWQDLWCRIVSIVRCNHDSSTLVNKPLKPASCSSQTAAKGPASNASRSSTDLGQLLMAVQADVSCMARR